MSGLSASELQKIRGQRTVGPKRGDRITQQDSKDVDQPDDAVPVVDDASSSKASDPIAPTMVRRVGKFKVQMYSGDSAVKALATFNSPWADADLSSQQLADLRKVLANHVEAEYAFCLQDKSTVPEDMLVLDYLEETTQVPKSDKSSDSTRQGSADAVSPKSPVHQIIYIKEKAKPEATKAKAIDALNKSFMVKFTDKGGEIPTTSIQSAELPGNIQTIQLRALRPYVNMSSDAARHEFCLKDGTSMGDSMTLKTYISKGEIPSDIDSELPILTVYFQKVGHKSIFSEASAEMKERGKIATKTNLAFDAGVSKPVTSEAIAKKATDKSKLGFDDKFLASVASVQDIKSLTPGDLDEMQWDTVLRNCNVMYGWKFDLTSMSIKRAPQPAFKLRKGLNLAPAPELPPSVPAASTTNQLTTSEPRATTKGDADEGKAKDDDGTKGAKSTPKPPAAPVSRRAKPEALPNFAVVDESRVEITLVSSSLEESMAKNNFTATAFEVGGSANIKGADVGGSVGFSERDEAGSGQLKTSAETLMIGNYRFPRASIYLRAEDLEPTEALRTAIDKVRVSKSLDELRGLYDSFGHLFCEEVLVGGRLQTTRATKITETYSESMAKSQFKAEVGLAVSIPKVASVNSKFSRETGSNEEKSQKGNNVSDSITFEATGGNTILTTNPPLWTQSVVDYRNWRVIERSNLTPIAQVIGRCSSLEMRQVRAWFTQAVPFLSKYIAVPETRVVPVRLKLNSQIPQMRRLKGQVFDRDICHYFGHQYGKCVRPVRVGLVLTTNVKEESKRQVVNEKQEMSTLEKISMSAPAGAVFQGVKMVANGVVTSDISTVFREQRLTEEIPLFTPARTQAPVILNYDESDLTAGVTKEQYRETVWKMIVPYGEWLQHDSLVMLTSASGTEHKDDVWLTVYRNAQGQFMPAMTSSGDASFWRIKKEDGNSKGREISGGNTIRLTWRFSDQTSGFRDFLDDTFGRRTFSRPANVQDDELHLKLPFPGFQKTTAADRAESESAGMAMIMSQVSTQAPILQELAISSKLSESAQKRTYNLHDTSFRIDLVGASGSGELGDYMTLGLNQALTQTFKEILSERTETRRAIDAQATVNAAMNKIDEIGTALLGPVFPSISAPAKSIISKVTGFFSSWF